MDIVSYALNKKIAEHAVSGVQSMSVEGQNLIINTKDSGVLTMTFPTPKDGVSVTDIDVNANNQIVFTMSDGTEFISGKIPTVKGDAGFSPTITENVGNTDKIYKLDITTVDSTFTTPNLKGGAGGSGEENKIDSISVNGINIAPDENKNVDITVPTVTNDLTDELKSLYDDAVTEKHTHDNKTVLDNITAEKVESWNKAEENVQSDWNETDDTADGFIKNKPTIPDAYDDTALSGRVDDVETSIGDMSTIEVKSVSDLVSAINVLYNAFMSSITYANKKLTITYRNGGTVDIDMSAIITDTNIGELSNIDDTGITDKQVLSYDTATNKYIPTTIDTAGVLADAKKYTDDEIAKINNADAISVDEKPTYSNGTITYKKDGVEKTITDGDFWFFYTVDNMAYQTIWIDGVEFTTSVDGSVDFKDFVSKTNDLTSTYTGEETDKTKVTTIASLDALYAIISTALSKKVNTTDIVDNLSSDATDKPLSAAQGKALDTKISNFITTVEEDYAKTTEIPTSLPASGGNSDTVNNHTVETNVPIDAVFTDTIYDDTEVKESIDELSSNLEQLKYSENGIDNLLELVSENATSNGVTLTNNGDGTLTFNGTSTNYPQFPICETILEAGTYIISSLNYDGYNPFLWIGTSKKDNDIANGRWNTDVIFTLSETKKIYVTLVCIPNDNPQNKLIKPMIVKGNAIPNTFRKYVKSNLQLTDEVKAQNDSLGAYAITNDMLESGNWWNGGSSSTEYIRVKKEYALQSGFKGYVTNNTGKLLAVVNYTGDTFVGSALDIAVDSTVLVEVPSGSNYRMYEAETDFSNIASNIIVATNGLGKEVTKIKNDLETLKLSEVAGGKNICKASDNGVINGLTLIKKDVSTIIISGASGSRAISENFNVKKGVTYTATFFTSSTNVTGFLWNSIKEVMAYPFGSSKTITFTQTEDETLCFAVTLTDTVSNVEISMQVEEGSKSTSFEPYIPSVKMLSDEVSAQNKSLGDYGLDNKFDGNIDYNKWYNKSNGEYQSSSTSATLTNKINCVASNNVRVMCPSATNVSIVFYNSSDEFISGTDKDGTDVQFIAPTNASYCRINFYKSGGFGGNIGKIGVYINNTIDELKNDLSVIGKYKNLLNPTLQTTTQNGVTCTANGDGTYTLNGTATSNIWFTLGKAKLYSGKTYRLCGLNKVDNSTLYIQLRNGNIITQTTNNGIDVSITETSENYLVVAFIPEKATYNNIIYKPMITKDLTVTYDDFVPYTGDGETLTHDVAQLKNDLGVKSGDIIYTSCEVEDSSFCWCKKSGHIVQCSLYLKNINTTTNWQAILTLPFRPCSTFYIYDKINDTEWKIDTNGNLTRFGLSTNLSMLVSFTYITND